MLERRAFRLLAALRLVAAAAVGVMWATVAVARLSLLVERPGPAIGQAVVEIARFADQRMPADAAYLYVDVNPYREDAGDGPRLRYELYPRRHVDLNAEVPEGEARAVIAREHLTYIVVPDVRLYPTGHWLRADRDGFRRVELDPDRFLLELVER